MDDRMVLKKQSNLEFSYRFQSPASGRGRAPIDLIAPCPPFLFVAKDLPAST